MITPNVKSALNALQILYRSGFLCYPRVDIPYLNQSFDIFPHKPLEVISEAFEPFHMPVMEVNEKTALLMLNTARLITPSIADSGAKVVDKFYEEVERQKKDARIRELIELKNKFYQEQNKVQPFSLGHFIPDFVKNFVKKSFSAIKFKIEGLFFDKNIDKKSLENIDEEAKQKIVYDGISFSNLSDLRAYIVGVNEKKYNKIEKERKEYDEKNSVSINASLSF